MKEEQLKTLYDQLIAIVDRAYYLGLVEGVKIGNGINKLEGSDEEQSGVVLQDVLR